MAYFQRKNPTPNPESDGVPVPIQAVRWNGDNEKEIYTFAREIITPGDVIETHGFKRGRLLLADEEFPCWVELGDWITRDDAGELDVWPNEHFEATFELVAEADLDALSTRGGA